MRGRGGRSRRCSSFWGAGTVTLFAAKHYSSLCSQSEGDDFLAAFAAPAPNVIRYVFVALTLRRSTVAHFARKVRGAIFWASFAELVPNVFRYVSVALTLRRSTVAHFARKVRGTIFGASFAAPAPNVFATCPWPSLCEQSELQCFAPITRPKKIVVTPSESNKKFVVPRGLYIYVVCSVPPC